MRMPLRGPFQGMIDGSIQFTPQPLIVAFHVFSRRPILWPIARQSSSHWIDSKRKKIIKSPLHGRQPKRALRQQIPIECFYVPQIKNDPVPFGNGSVVNGLLAHNPEQLVGLRSSI
jgi:hypothetical protein